MSNGRPQIPQEYYDVTSKTLLIQPQPQFLHGNLIMGAVNAKLNTDSGLFLPMQGRQITSSGAPYIDLSAQQLELSAAISQDAIRVVPDFQPGSETPGHTIRMNRPVYQSTSYSQATRELTGGVAISQVPVNVSSEQVALTVKRWGGPYDQANSRVAPFSINKFDASRSLHDFVQIIGSQFQRDFVATVDFFGVALFDQCASANVVYAGSMTQDNDAVLAGDNPFTFSQLLRTERLMDEASIPYFPTTRRRMCIISPYQSEQLKNDPDWQRGSQLLPDMNALYQGTYVGTAGAFDVLKSTTLSKPSNSSSVPVHYGQAFGPNAIGVGPAGMPSIEPHTNDNYGQDALAIWLWFCAFGVLDNRFLFSMRSS